MLVSEVLKQLKEGDVKIPPRHQYWNKVWDTIIKLDMIDESICNAWDMVATLDKKKELNDKLFKFIEGKVANPTDEDEVFSFVMNNYTQIDICNELIKAMYYDRYIIAYEGVVNELKRNDLIYRKIFTPLSLDEVLQYTKTKGTGVCWAKHYNKAESYCAEYSTGNSYILYGIVTEENINFIATILLRMGNYEENEVRLKINSPIRIVQIQYENQNYDIDEIFSTGKETIYKDYMTESTFYGDANWQNNMDALGNVPATIGHNLFMTMFPYHFLSLCPEFSYGDDKFFDDYLIKKDPLGIPFLKVEFDFDKKDMRVIGHEGRHRVSAIRRRRNGDIVDIPVAILYNKDMYPQLPSISEFKREWTITSQNGDKQYNVGQFSLYNQFPTGSKGWWSIY